MASLSTKKIGLVLSGGGVRGMAHIGVIKAMQEFGLEAQLVAGSSVGALVGALYANGTPIMDMLRFFKETPLFKYNFISIGKPGLLDTDRYEAIFKAYFPHNTFEGLKKGLYVVATNLEKGEELFIHQGELIKPLLASAALPPVFSPVSYNGSLYADGGIMNNFPLEPVRDKVDFVIGSNVSIVSELNKKNLTNSLQLTGRVTGLMIYAINREKIKKCNLVIEPKSLEHIGILDRKGIEKAYAIGYESACKQLETLGS
ncbi:patatin-like phospholipase family protein [Maribacter sp. 4G9]|uniref:patatin-like phospholipase family protein n=1 Tax=Maribacter sp. 4G9 TaxID=1889777 RepID=UPI000C156284|nr:patatin-like phospholipase family protein [Maribacter sp. 4G9]PIB23424.1 phospholipase [Maribacter sp. 4G9]